jgi:AcrR family transcriptional regulator
MNVQGNTLPLRTRKPRGQGASRRGEILEAAKRLFIEEGFPQATMRRIAAVVGVSPTALYLHFSDKEAILQAIADDFFDELLVELHNSEGTETTPLAKLRAGMCAYVKFALERTDEYRLTFQVRHAKLMLEPHEKVGHGDLPFEVLEAAVQRLLDDGVFRPGDPEVIAESIWCALHGLTAVLMDHKEQAQSARDVLMNSVIDMILIGLACREPDVLEGRPGLCPGPAGA